MTTESNICPKCGTTMCQKFDDKRVNEIASLAIPNGDYVCYKCGFELKKADPRGMNFNVEGSDFVIRIPLSTLEWAAVHSDAFTPFDDGKNDFVEAYAITDIAAFSRGVALGISDEAEDGSTPLTRILDDAFLYALENDYGVDEVRRRKP